MVSIASSAWKDSCRAGERVREKKGRRSEQETDGEREREGGEPFYLLTD